MAGSGSDAQDGDDCPDLADIESLGPSSIFPDGMRAAGNYSLIGAPPHDLGALMQSGASVPMPRFDNGASLEAIALSGTPLAHPPGYGVSFAVGGAGTVSPTTGAFVHPFTLLALPSPAASMGLLLRLEYLSNALHSNADPQPFGHGFVLSGHDFLVETAGSSQNEGATQITIFRGDGDEVRYGGRAGTSPDWVYTGFASAYDTLKAHYDAGTNSVSYTRTLRDGRRIVYERVAPFGSLGSDRYVRSRVEDGYGNTILYTWNKAGGVAELQSITDTRGVRVAFHWDSGLPKRVDKVFIDSTTVELVPTVPATDLEISFAYDALRRLQRIEWFRTEATHDSNGNDSIETGETVSVRPTIELEFESNNKLAKVWNKTLPASPLLQIHNEYQSSGSWGVRVVKQAEGATIGTPGAITHTYGYIDQVPRSRTYVDPRGTSVVMALDSGFRPNQVTMTAGPRPRDADPQPAPTGYQDYVTLTWQLSYACCGLPISIIEPNGRAWAFAWTGNSLTEVWMGSARLHLFTVSPFGRVLTWRRGTASAQYPTLRFVYTFGTGGEAAGAVTQVVASTPPHTDMRGTQHPDMTTTLAFSSLGQITSIARSGLSLQTTYTYVQPVDQPSDRGLHLLKSISGPDAGADLQLTYACDDLGRLITVQRGVGTGTRTTNVVADSLLRLRSVSAKAIASGPDLKSEMYYDHFGALSWARSENRDETGAFRPRPWLQRVLVRDSLGRVVRSIGDGAVVDAPAETKIVTQTTWLPDHRMATTQGPNGSVTTYVWDGYGMLYKTIVDDGQGGLQLKPARYYYDQIGNVERVRDDLGNELKVDRYGSSSTFFGMIERIHDPAGLNAIALTYDADFRTEQTYVISPPTQTIANGTKRRTTLAYDGLGRVQKVTVWAPDVPFEKSHIYVYDDAGRLIELGLQEHSNDLYQTGYRRGWRRAFDDQGRLQWQRDRLSDLAGKCNEIAFEYDAATGLPTKLIEREVEQAQFGVVAATDLVRTYETLLQHDLLDRVTRVEQVPTVAATLPAVVHHYHYDSQGSLVRFQDALGAELRWVFDALGDERRRTEQGTQGGQITTLTNTDYGTGLVTRTDAEGRVSRFYHDKAWRLTKQELPGFASGTAFSHQFFYDLASRLTSIVNGNGITIRRSYDASGRLKEQWADPAGVFHSILATKEILNYGVFGELLTAETKWNTDYSLSMVKVTEVVDGLGRTRQERYEFGAAWRDVLSNYSLPFGTEDLLVRRSLSATDVPTVDFALDRLGRTWQYGKETGNSDDARVARYRFVGGRVRERQQGKPGALNVTPAWLTASNYGWDELRRLTSIETTPVAGGAALSRFDHEYDLEGHMLKRKRDRGTAAGGGDWFKLDEYYRLAGVKLGVPASQFGATHSNAAFDAITSFEKHVDYSPAAGPLDKAQNRHLVRETANGQTTDTTYAVNGASHRYDSVGGVALQYDGEGNLLFDGAFYYVYDFKNRLSEVWRFMPAPPDESLQASGQMSREGTPRYLVPRERLARIRHRARDGVLAPWRIQQQGLAGASRSSRLADQSSTTSSVDGNLMAVAFYGYDPFNRRVVRIVAEQATLYSTWDGWREAAEYTLAGSTWTPVRAYVWGGRIDELVRFSNYLGGTNPWAHYFPQQDHQDSVDLLVDDAGQAVEKCEYDPFGGVKVFTASGGGAWTYAGSTSPVQNPYLYTGRRRDAETGLYYYRNRYYSAVFGRFLTTDPVGLWADSLSVGNPYSYCGNSPVCFTDPAGQQAGHHIVPRALWQTPSVGPPRHDFSEAAKEVFKTATTGAPAGGLPRDLHAFDGPHRRYSDAVRDMVGSPGKPLNKWTTEDAQKLVDKVLDSSNPTIAGYLSKIEDWLGKTADTGATINNRGISRGLRGSSMKAVGRFLGKLAKPIKILSCVLLIDQLPADSAAYGDGWAVANAVNPWPFSNPTDWFGVPDQRPVPSYYPRDFVGPLPAGGVHY